MMTFFGNLKYMLCSNCRLRFFKCLMGVIILQGDSTILGWSSSCGLWACEEGWPDICFRTACVRYCWWGAWETACLLQGIIFARLLYMLFPLSYFSVIMMDQWVHSFSGCSSTVEFHWVHAASSIVWTRGKRG